MTASNWLSNWKRLWLDEAFVVPAPERTDAGGIAKAVGLALGQFLTEVVADDMTIGVGWGRTMTASLSGFSSFTAGELQGCLASWRHRGRAPDQPDRLYVAAGQPVGCGMLYVSRAAPGEFSPDQTGADRTMRAEDHLRSCGKTRSGHRILWRYWPALNIAVRGLHIRTGTSGSELQLAACATPCSTFWMPKAERSTTDQRAGHVCRSGYLKRQGTSCCLPAARIALRPSAPPSAASAATP